MNYLKFLRSGDYEIRFKWLSKFTEGLIDYEKDTITINIYTLIVEVFIHEALHAKHPNWSEKKVENKTELELARMPVKRIKQLAGEILLKGGFGGNHSR